MNEEQLRAAVAEQVKRDGVSTVSQRLGVSRQSIMTLCAGFPVRRGTLAVIRESLSKH